MPIPDTKLVDACKTLQDLHDLYAREPYKWSKILEFDWIGRSPDGWTLTRYRFVAEDLDSCGCRDRARMTYVILMPTGVVRTCAGCRKTMGTLPFDMRKSGQKIDAPGVTKIDSWDISREEMEVARKKTNQQLEYNVDLMEKLDSVRHLRK